MVKLFLVEDEIAMREGIRRRIPWEEEGVDYCGEAGDGELAWPQILEKKPDIVITDIKMPFMDGLELSRLIRQELPETKIVILSGYTEFRYAQDALRIGVTEYLVKPITPRDLREVVRKLVLKIREEKQTKQEQMGLIEEEEKEKAAHQRRKFFRSLVSGDLSSHELLVLSEETGLPLRAPYYQMLLLYVQYSADLESQRRMETMLNSLEEDIPGCCLFENSVDSQAILLSAASPDELQELRDRVSAQVLSAAEASGSQPFFISTGKPVSHMSEIKESWIEAHRAGSYRFFLPPNRIVGGDIPIHDLIEESRGAASPGQIDTESLLEGESLRNAWESFLRTGTLQEIDDFIDDLFSSVGEDNVRSIIFLSYITMDSYFSMARFLKELGQDPQEISGVCGDINDVIASVATAEDAKSCLKGYLTEVIRVRDSSSSRKNHQILKDAVEYIDAHYTDEEMSLNQAALAAGLSPNRFSALFSREMGMTFIEYLIGKRMEKARELLMNTDLRSSEIAYRSGYKDPHYFSATFKKLHGLSPREYRMRGKDEHEEE